VKLPRGALVIWVACLALAGDVRGARAEELTDATAWSEAEAAVRAQFTYDRIKLRAVTHLPGHGFCDFQIELASGARTGAVVVDGRVFVRGKRSNRTVGAILAAADVLTTHAYDADDLLYLLDAYGSFLGSQRELQRAIAARAWPPGHEPVLTWGRHGATLVVFHALSSRHRGSSPTTTLGKATLTLSAGHGISWKRGSVRVPTASLVPTEP
jgi:hypothetical protein